MKKTITFIKIISLALIFAIAIHFSYSFFTDEEIYNEESEIKKIDLSSGLLNNNKYNFKKANTIILGNVGVALTTNIGIKYKQREKNNLYKSVPVIGKNISEKSYAEKLSRKSHMGNIKEYYNILKTDLKGLLDRSTNRKDTLEAYIAQLKFRYNSTNDNLRVLAVKKLEYERDLKNYTVLINKIKAKIKYDFNNFDGSKTEENIENLLKAKADYNYANAYKTYVVQYMNQYKYLNKKGKKLYDTLVNNKEAIVRGVQVVIPKSGLENLKRLQIITNEK